MLKRKIYKAIKNKTLLNLLFVLILSSIVFETTSAQQLTASTKTDSFENNLSNIWSKEMSNTSYSGALSTNYSVDGNYSYRIELHKGDSLPRSEIKLNSEQPLEEHIYKFNILLPKGTEEDYKIDPNSSEILAQWHNTPDQNEPWTSPPLALRTKNGHYYLDRLWDDAQISSNTGIYRKGNYATYDLGSYEGDKGKFVEWKFHVKWGWLASQKPILEVYKNGVKILDCSGKPNTTNDKKGVYMKLGIYKWEWGPSYTVTPSILTKRVVYYDNVTIQ